jgi:hypothetical protein
MPARRRSRFLLPLIAWGSQLQKTMENQPNQARPTAGPAPARPRKPKKTIPPPGPATCKKYMRRRLAKDLPAIANHLLDGAREGNLGYIKMLVQLCGLDDKEIPKPAAPKRGKTLEELLMEDWRKEPADVPDGAHR